MNAQTYVKLLADLERERLEIERDLELLKDRQTELILRKWVVDKGIKGIQKVMEVDE